MLHASFCRAAFGGQGACLSWYHSSIIFPAGSQGPVEREEKGGEVGSLQSPLCGPWQHLLMGDATQTLTCSLFADLPSSLSSSLPLSTALSSCRQSTRAVHRGMSLSPPSLHLVFSFLSPSCFICLGIPHLHSPGPPFLPPSLPPSLSLSCCLLLTHCPPLFCTQHTLQKTTLKQTFLLVSLRSGTSQWLYGIYTEYKLCSGLQHL